MFEIFILPSGSLIYSDFSRVTSSARLDAARDYLIIRRSGEALPTARIISLTLNEFLNWHVGKQNHFEAFSDLSHKDYLFISGDSE